ncbi:hypothetical protein bsdE14_39950 [Clostridium omnivorum]|uniref:Uncharacterized protein n=1 Tax=Clostridium omnivorum TaxID=1604902 RepID=A0ABQ5NBK6_9CLOT|nr:hypothetical protein bsdE14_39950 [Clostridium sp. E14]
MKNVIVNNIRDNLIIVETSTEVSRFFVCEIALHKFLYEITMKNIRCKFIYRMNKNISNVNVICLESMLT